MLDAASGKTRFVQRLLARLLVEGGGFMKTGWPRSEIPGPLMKWEVDMFTGFGIRKPPVSRRVRNRPSRNKRLQYHREIIRHYRRVATVKGWGDWGSAQDVRVNGYIDHVRLGDDAENPHFYNDPDMAVYYDIGWDDQTIEIETGRLTEPEVVKTPVRLASRGTVWDEPDEKEMWFKSYVNN